MSVRAVIGTQWGDEGKGKISDHLAQESDVIIRSSGGNNAGHTVINEHGEFKLHIVPVGILNPNTINIIGAGPVVHLPTLVEELREIDSRGVARGDLLISKKAHLVMPWHIMQDEAEENSREASKFIGTTKRGMGPVFADKAARKGLRAGDLLDFDSFYLRFLEIYKERRALLEWKYPTLTFPYPGEVFEEYAQFIPQAVQHIADAETMIWDALDANKNILIEGAQAILLGIDHGTYPFVTSSNCGVAQASEGSGIPPHLITERIGIVKAYTTRIGAGAFPTRIHGDAEENLRELGNEYGATTGRPRMCGWIDLPLLRYAARLNGFTSIAVTKIDVLNTFKKIPFGKGYTCQDTLEFSSSPYCALGGAKAVLGRARGWNEDISDAQSWEDLPPRLHRYVERIEQAMDCPAQYISTGPAREQTIVRY